MTDPLLSESSSPLTPTASLLTKLGSIVRHVEEGGSITGHQLDWNAVDALMDDPEVAEWMAAMDDMALLPVKR